MNQIRKSKIKLDLKTMSYLINIKNLCRQYALESGSTYEDKGVNEALASKVFLIVLAFISQSWEHVLV